VSDETGIRRYAKPANPKQYMESLKNAGYEPDIKALGAADRLFEFMLNALRLTDGFHETLFEQRTGLAVGLLRDRMQPVVSKGLVSSPGDGLWQVTPLGRRFLNDLQAEFLPK